MPADPAVVRVVTAYGNQTTAVRGRVVDYVTRVWGSLDAYRDADIERFVRAVVPVVQGGMLQTATLTDAYLAAVESAVLGAPVAPLGVPARQVTTEAIRGVPAQEVYTRAGRTVWSALAEGDTFPNAVRRGLNRALDMATMDVQLAKTHASRSVLGRKGDVVGYRRTLTGNRSCGLCIVASTQRYRKKDLLPCHPGCDCGTLPIYGNRDPGQVIDPDRLEGVHEAIAERFGAFNSGAREIPGVSKPDTGDPLTYKDVLVVHDHGELGPVLGVRGQNFDGPDAI